jgi:hypothetical protein
MSSKISIVILKSKSVDSTSDINKMVVHLEQILTEKEGIDLKVRQSLTDSIIKSSKFIIFAGWDSSILCQFFNALSVIEKQEMDEGKKLFLFDEPGKNCWTDLNRILTFGMDIERFDPVVFDSVVDCWNYRDIMSYIDLDLRRLELNASSGTTSTV